MAAAKDTEHKIDGPAAEEKILLQWTTRPFKARPIAAVLVGLLILIIGLLVFYETTSKMFGALAMLVLFMSLSKFYLPTTFTLTELSVSVKTTTQTIRKSWGQYRSYYPDRNGVLLSPFPEPSRLENFRGIYLMFANNRDEVLRVVEERIRAHASLNGSEERSAS